MNTWQSTTLSRETVNGDCGSILILESPQGYFIGGFHYGGLHSTALSIAIHRGMLPKKDDVFSTQGGTYEFLGTEEYPKNITSLHHKSTLRYLEEGECDALGSLSGFIPRPRTTVCNTPISEALKEYGYEIKYTKPQMSGWLPKRLAVAEMIKPISKMDFGILRKAKDSFFEKGS